MVSEPEDSLHTIRLDAVHTYELGRVIGDAAPAGLIIALQGDLGAGKTTFTQGLAAGMGIEDRVTSPTFTLVNEYGSSNVNRLIHIDTYRLGELPDEVLLESATFGLEEMLDPDVLTDPDQGAIAVIEWAERIESVLPEDRLHITIQSSGDAALRDVELTAGGDVSREVLQTVHRKYAD